MSKWNMGKPGYRPDDVARKEPPEDKPCQCRCHKSEPEGWDSEQCCPDCGPSLVQEIHD